MNLNNALLNQNSNSIIRKIYAWAKTTFVRGGNAAMTDKKFTDEEKELMEMLNRINKQDETLRKLKKDDAPYSDLSKGKNVVIHTNDKKAMKFWEE
ncbi:MAG: hypothetical protein ACQEWW_26395 [Bacillota bacterium]